MREVHEEIMTYLDAKATQIPRAFACCIASRRWTEIPFHLRSLVLMGSFLLL